MCLLIVIYRIVPDYPIIVAANRDESYERPSLPPHKVSDSPTIIAGKDERAGGTWLGVNEFGVLVGVTNRRPETKAPRARSRGLLCMDALRKCSAKEVRALVESQAASGSYNPFNLLYADSKNCWASHFDGESAASEEIGDGSHILTNNDVDDRSDPRIHRAFTLLRRLDENAEIGDVVERLMAICRDHQADVSRKQTLCVHGGAFGTVSSTIIALSDGFPRRRLYLHAEGHPCDTDYNDFSHLFSCLA